jgi:uncharacterized membrane protein (UPF0127 family)
MSRPPLPRALAALALAGAGILAASCERRVEEPTPLPRRFDDRDSARQAGLRPDTPVDAAPLGETAAPTAPNPLAGRCVRPTPAEPKRKTPPSPDPKCPPDPEKPPKLREGKVTFEGAAGRSVGVEIAERDRDRQRGLMYRTKMAEDRGMIFVFEERTNHSFWMHNTCIPLDMLYIDKDGLVVGIEENTPTMSDDTFDVGCLSQYVLEVNAGFTRKHGIKAGQWVKIEL